MAIVSKNWFFEDVAQKDRFVQRQSPNQSDRPSQSTLQNLVDTLALQVDLDIVETQIITLTNDVDTLETSVSTKASQSSVNSLSSTVSTHTGQIANLEADVLQNTSDIVDLQTLKADKTYLDSNFSKTVNHLNNLDTTILDLQNNKLNVSTFNSTLNPILQVINVERIVCNFSSTVFKYYIPLVRTENIIIKNIEVRNLNTWKLTRMKGDFTSNTEITNNSTYQSSSNYDVQDGDTDVNGILIEITLTNPAIPLGAMVLKVQYD